MVLKWLGGGKLDHPLATDKGAREVLASLPGNDSVKAIEEIRQWVESAVSTEGFRTERRAELVLFFDDAAQSHQRKVAREYFSSRRAQAQELRLWGAQLGLWRDLASAYAACLAAIAAEPASAARLKAQLPSIVLRSLRAAAAQLKWHCIRYEAANEAWRVLCGAYRFAEEQRLHRQMLPVHPGTQALSSPELEFKKALMLAASAPDSLMPLEIELAERVIAYLSGALILSDVHLPHETYHAIDIAHGTPPKRLTEIPAALPGLRFFSAGAANAKLQEIIRVAASGAPPADLQLGGSYDIDKVLVVLRHLQLYWAATPPVRKHDRYPVNHRLSVVNGFEGVSARLNGRSAEASAESWMTENISAGGISAVLENAQADWLGIGTLVGLTVEGGSGACALGVVCRCSRLAKLRTSVGIRTFAKDSCAVTLGARAQEAFLLDAGTALKSEVLLCQRDGTFEKRSSAKMSFGGRDYLLIPVEVVETGEDFEIARYRVMQQGG